MASGPNVTFSASEAAPGRPPARRVVSAAVAVAAVWVAVTVSATAWGTAWSERMLSASLLVAVLPLVVIVLGALQPAYGPPAFVVRPGAGLVVPAGPRYGYFVAAQILFTGFVCGQAVRQWTVPGGGADPAVVDRVLAAVLSVLAVVLVVVVAGEAVRVLACRPVVVLTPQALVIRGPLGSRAVPWAALRSARPAAVDTDRGITVTVERPELVMRRGLTRATASVRTGDTWVHPQFLADAVRYYVDQPARRETIGSLDGYARLRADLGLPR